ncbi:hypothetical protein FRX31_032684 [Thalictrum thalictroides]|uniref:Reverse transcriptase zinc-binding domain-containing protein n=1 Tax=Thalictrum thalictroides TaxID=46969 RepID=A0A7J6V048_THATH|nr:hypothetical protein FRX31_032684 [Thalictrum thalictroides]
MKSKGISIASVCALCKNQEETLDHLLWHCPKTRNIWKWVADSFHTNENFVCLEETEKMGAWQWLSEGRPQ